MQVIVNQDKRTVVAILSVPCLLMGDELSNIMYKETREDIPFALYLGSLSKRLQLQEKYIGKAVCHSEDEWDEEKGIAIARLRAIKQYAKDRKRILSIMKEIFDGIEDRLGDAKKYAKYSIEHIDDAIEKLSSDEDEKED